MGRAQLYGCSQLVLLQSCRQLHATAGSAHHPTQLASHAWQVALLPRTPNARRPQCTGAQRVTARQRCAICSQHRLLCQGFGAGVGIGMPLRVREVGQRLITILNHLAAIHHIAATMVGSVAC